MKALWNTLAVMCMVNLLAMVAFVGWLANSGRLNRARVQEVREVFATTLAEEQAEAEAAEAESLELNDGLPFSLPDTPPIASEDQLTTRMLQSSIDRQRIQRLEREVADLRDALRRERTLLNEQRTELQAERTEFESMRQSIAQTEGAAQFQKALGTMESVPPKAAMEMLLALIRSGSRDEAVGYLNAMQDRSRTKVVGELVKSEETELAAGLLEELRIRGVGDVPPEALAP